MIEKYTLLHLDDDPLELRALKRILENNENKKIIFDIISTSNINQFKKQLTQFKKIDFVLLDIHLAEGHSSTDSGFNLIHDVKKSHPQTTILMSSNLDDPASVLESLQLGADEFLSKKSQVENLQKRLLSIREKSLIKKGFIQLQNDKAIKNSPTVCGEMMKKIEQRIPNIIASAIKFIYVEGESGTGKEVVADLFASFLDHQPFVKLNCAGIPKDLLESELFGHKKGSFTGAHFDKKGVIESANGGWLFLDEVASLTPSAQSALLRTLENQEVTPIGETQARKINVRFISASNISLANMVTKGEFRNDLWQRLRETEIILLPLRQRPEEIIELIYGFCKTMEGGPYTIEDTALNVLCKLPWQEGNARELRNCLRAMTENHNQKVLSPMGIPQRILSTYKNIEKTQTSQPENHTPNAVLIPTTNNNGVPLTFEEMSSQLLRSIINQSKQEDGKINITKLSKQLKIARSTLQAKIKSLYKFN